jgi:3-phosphoshikimate 1-carboxyvinyltransferase
MPDMSLTLAAVAAVARTPSLFTGVLNLKHKESDRLAALVNELEELSCGAEVSDDGNSLTITPAANGIPAAEIATYDDHRVAMAFGLLTLRNPDLTILDKGCVAKTWPDYFEVLSRFAQYVERASA